MNLLNIELVEAVELEILEKALNILLVELLLELNIVLVVLVLVLKVQQLQLLIVLMDMELKVLKLKIKHSLDDYLKHILNFSKENFSKKVITKYITHCILFSVIIIIAGPTAFFLISFIVSFTHFHIQFAYIGFFFDFFQQIIQPN